MENILSTNPRSNRNGLIIVHTGDGKGKTTAAIGTAFRALGWGWKISMVQFLKGTWDTGEKIFSESLGDLFHIYPMGSGFTWNTKNRDADIRDCEKILRFLEALISKCEDDIIIIDEINVVMNLGYLSPQSVIDVIRKKPKWMTVFLTGRNAPNAIIELADLVTEMKEIKHPFQRGIPAQLGVDF